MENAGQLIEDEELRAQIKGSGIRYAITANGSAIYELETKKCLREEAMDEELFLPIVEYLLTKDIHMDAFIGGARATRHLC